MLDFTIQPFGVHGKKENAMQILNIKTHRISAAYKANHFFILSKGYNAGKPLDKPCPNCFVITTDSKEDKQKLFWICYSLWKAGRYIPLLVGSVIPFIRIRDVQDEIKRAIEKSLLNPVEFSKMVEQFQAFHLLENQLTLQTKLIARIKVEMAKRLFG
ncbi:DUF6943 family protein [Chryseolinea lacunae]|uniref:Type I restriction modification DNA specificity domain-containing protein n=1 Tax=Chryseolinea lacunae TaxID=2801331 RepID=A0ABS1KZJ1_9BACT|nr:hypothetical protein [Chryseolinea lacunae]MBL0744870.1 hypothetical protein [Chryseolinea lacunae]